MARAEANARYPEGAAAPERLDPLSRFTCPVCLEVFENPVRAPCGHVFCTLCIQECLKPKKPVCGVCRRTLSHGSRDLDLEKQIEMTETTCNGCNKKMYLSKLRSHAASCSKYQNYIMEGVRAVTKDPPQDTRSIPNRFTFPCPYCNERNLDQEGLVEHCRKYHSMDAKRVVCPICASMPWGDPNYRSANFMEHLQRRHQFSYDTFVDYDADEDDMMAQVLLRSLRDK
ncbi:E3 ubiquitin-protein ligase RNF114 [Varanus komodoensis]|uniref:E3 ubiquitin-protein ligase RNF114 n=1 Tax=Varanus komodoensis TaxID=61221 RepID=A0A8D2KSF1_VARKO|nr:E3 ubiquitin-protein ligase RNF114 [Varanus komodoensis]